MHAKDGASMQGERLLGIGLYRCYQVVYMFMVSKVSVFSGTRC